MVAFDVQTAQAEKSSDQYIVYPVISIILIIIVIIGLWKVYVKAGKEGWTAIIPIYNLIILLQIVGKPCWWTLLYFIPIVNFIIGIIVMCHLADRFGKTSGFKLGLIFLPPIFLCILGFDDSKYIPLTDEEKSLETI